MKNIGRIDIIMGCMFSGKSTEIIRLINRYKALDKKILIVNHSKDIRYKKDSISTHSNINIDCISIENLDTIKSERKYEYTSKDVIVIEEAQFFNNLYEFVLTASEKDNKIIILAGLDGDSNRNEFGDIIKLIPKCDSVVKLHALCTICKDGTLAPFTKRLVDNKAQIFIGIDEFIPVCRYHYLNDT
jgi:thymidine kinase